MIETSKVKRIGASFSHQISSMSLTDSGKYVCLASNKCTQISREINVQGKIWFGWSYTVLYHVNIPCKKLNYGRKEILTFYIFSDQQRPFDSVHKERHLRFRRLGPLDIFL